MLDRAVRREMTRYSFLDESAGLRFSSPLFSVLARRCADDPEMLDLGSRARPGQPAGMLIFMAAQYLLLRSPRSALAAYFPSLTDHPKPVSEAFPLFREFCLEQRAELMELVAARTLNANVVERTSCILPVLQHVRSQVHAPVTLIEICCSVGLNLLFDRYRYDYGTSGQAGSQSSPLQLSCKVIGTGRPPVNGIPEVLDRVGVDLVSIDVSDPQERLWMEAMLCPEWKTEREHLKTALSIRAAHNLRILNGDALQVLPSLLEEIPGDLCLLHTFCMLQWSAESKAELDVLLRNASHDRQIHRVGVEVPESEQPETIRARLARLAAAGIPMLQKSFPARIQHTAYVKGTVESRTLGQGDGFGAWLDWYPTGA